MISRDDVYAVIRFVRDRFDIEGLGATLANDGSGDISKISGSPEDEGYGDFYYEFEASQFENAFKFLGWVLDMLDAEGYVFSAKQKWI